MRSPGNLNATSARTAMEDVTMVTQKETCQVCGKLVASGDLYSRPVHRGKRYPICCPVCLALFQKDPEKHIRDVRLPGKRTT